MTPASDFQALVLPYATGLSTVAANRAILDSAIEFCRKTLLIEESPSTAVLALANSATPVIAMLGMVPVLLMSARWNGQELDAATPDQLDRDFPDWRTRQESAPRYVIGDPGAPGRLTLAATPTVGGTLGTTFALAPGRAATSVPDVLYDVWAEGIAAGALARVLVLPGQPFTNLDAAGGWALRFAQAIADARLEASERQTRGRSTVQRFAFGSR